MDKYIFRSQVASVMVWLKEENGEAYEHDEAIAREWVLELYRQLKSMEKVKQALIKKHLMHPTKRVEIRIVERYPKWKMKESV